MQNKSRRLWRIQPGLRRYWVSVQSSALSPDLGQPILLVQQTKKKGVFPEIDAGEGIRLALLLFGLLRSVATLGSDERKIIP